MTITEHRESYAKSRSALWAWIAVALAPIGLLFGIALGFMSDERGGTGREFGGALVVLVALALPTAAVGLSVAAARNGHASGRAAVAVSGLELVLILVGLPTLVFAFGTFFAALAIYLATVTAVVMYGRHRAARR